MRGWLIVVGAVLLLGVALLGSPMAPSGLAPQREVGTAPTQVVVRAGTPPALPEGGGIGSAPTVVGTLRLEGLVLDDEERPVGGARVTVDGARVTVTEADGSFAFDGLAPATYAVIAEHGAWYGEDLTASLDETSDPVTIEMVRGPTLRVHVVGVGGAPLGGATVGTSSRDAITGADGLAVLRGIDMDTDHLGVYAVGHARVHQRLTTGDDPAATIELTVVLVAGAPLAGTVIDSTGRLIADASVEIETPNGDRTETVTTDENGAWTTEEIAAGTYMLRASADAYVATKDLVVPHTGLVPRTAITVTVARGAEIAGIVTERGGAPVADAEVFAGRKRIKTGADGRFVVAGLEPDRYDVSASTKLAGAATQVVTLTAGARVEVTIVLQPSSIAGRVVDPRGDGIEDALVFARSTDPLGSGFARTDELGGFDLGGLPPGDYELEVQRDDQQVRLAGVKLRVRSGARALRIVLPELAAIAGRVLQDGVPVPYFGVAVLADGSSPTSETPRPVREVSGSFVERGLTAGTWTVVVVGPTFARRTIEKVRIVDGEITQLGDIVVTAGASLVGRVVDEQGRAIAGAKVEVTADLGSADTDRLRGLLGDAHVATSDGRGGFRIDGLSAVERRQIAATHPTRGISSIQPVEPSQREITIVIRATGSIVGTLVNLTPVLRVYSVVANPVDGPYASYDGEIDATGRYTIANLPAGAYTVRVRGKLAIPPQQTTVVTNARTVLDFQLPRDPVTLIVEVVGPCSLVWLHEPGTRETLGYESCDGARATFQGIRPGSYELCLESGDCRSIAVPVQREHVLRVVAAQSS